MTRRKRWTIGKTRSSLYKAGRILGDINAVKRGRIGQRVVRRGLGRASGGFLAGLMRWAWRERLTPLFCYSAVLTRCPASQQEQKAKKPAFQAGFSLGSCGFQAIG